MYRLFAVPAGSDRRTLYAEFGQSETLEGLLTEARANGWTDFLLKSYAESNGQLFIVHLCRLK